MHTPPREVPHLVAICQDDEIATRLAGESSADGGLLAPWKLLATLLTLLSLGIVHSLLQAVSRSGCPALCQAHSEEADFLLLGFLGKVEVAGGHQVCQGLGILLCDAQEGAHCLLLLIARLGCQVGTVQVQQLLLFPPLHRPV